MLYTDGLTVVFAFAGIYAAKVFNFPQDKVIMFAIAVNIFCGIGAIAGGIIEDRIGAFKTVRLSLFCLLYLEQESYLHQLKFGFGFLLY